MPLKLRREAADLRQAEPGAAIGHSGETVSSVERGGRAPGPEFPAGADEALGAGGRIAAMRSDVAEARCPRRVRDLARLEAEAVEPGAYGNHDVHGLLQAEEHARALFAMAGRRTARTGPTGTWPLAWRGRTSSSAAPRRC